MQKNELIYLGRYPHEESGEEKPIEWRVLKVMDGAALLIASEALDAQPMHKMSADPGPVDPPTANSPIIPAWQKRMLDIPYEQSWIFQWLNGEFLDRAFTASEQDLLLEAASSTQPGKGLGKVFALSIDDINDSDLFPTDHSTGCTATPYAASLYTDDLERSRQECEDRPYAPRASWWLRNHGIVWGGGAHAHGVIAMRLDVISPLAVRPAILLDTAAWERKNTSFLDRLLGRKPKPRLQEPVTFNAICSADIKVDDKPAGKVLQISHATPGQGAKLVFLPKNVNQQPVEMTTKPGIQNDHIQRLMNLFALACIGQAEAQMTLGSLYWNGIDVPQSYEESVRWDRYGANQGNACAMIDLAECYSKGLGGLPKDDTKAFELVKTAAEKGLPLAM